MPTTVFKRFEHQLIFCFSRGNRNPRSQVATAIVITNGSILLLLLVSARHGHLARHRVCCDMSGLLYQQFYIVRGCRGDFNHMRLTNRCLAQVYHVRLIGNVHLITRVYGIKVRYVEYLQ